MTISGSAPSVAWLGPLGSAPPEVRARLDPSPHLEAMRGRGLDPQATLLYVPADDGVAVLAQAFAWDDHTPVTWLLTTIGIASVEQAPRSGRPAFRRFELVVGCRPGMEHPFPARIGVVLSAGGSLPGWDWSQVKVPEVVTWLSGFGASIRDRVAAGSHFTSFDRLAGGLVGVAWTGLDHALLAPATVHMLLKGHAPFDRPDEPRDTVPPRAWLDAPGTERFAYGCYWLLPVSKAEHDRAAAAGASSVLADLLARAPKEAEDACFAAFDLLRAST